MTEQIEALPYVKKGLKGFIRGIPSHNKNKSSWNKGISSSSIKCLDCGVFLSSSKEHICKKVELKGDRYCNICTNKLKNSNWERYSKICAPCGKKVQRQKESDLRKKLIEMFGSRCAMCNYDKHSFCLEFHHLFKSDKKNKRFLKSILANPERFQLLCNRCHREVEFASKSKLKTSYGKKEVR